MFIECIPNRNSPPAILLREAWQEGKKIRKRTIANLTHLGWCLQKQGKTKGERYLCPKGGGLP